jgi:UDPglucose 6-dehydrogenase
MIKKNKKIGFIGQGWIGKNYADDFEKRGYEVIRYSLDEKYINNGDKIKDCDIVFIAVPTPTVNNVFDDRLIRSAIKKVGNKKIAVIKSTILPGTTESIQAENKDIFVMHSPEFLREATAAYDASHPERNVVGISKDNQGYRKLAKEVLSVLPKAKFEIICKAKEAEICKYAGNSFLYLKVVFVNLLYELSMANDCDWDVVKGVFAADPRIGGSHLDPVSSGGRGAGGHCFIKDFAAFANYYKNNVEDRKGFDFLNSTAEKNIDLLIKSGKNIDILGDVYGAKTIDGLQKK